MLLALLCACPHPVDVTLTNVQLAPTTSAGSAWDGPDKIEPGATNLLGAVVDRLDPTGNLAAAVKSTTSTIILPDVAGSMEFRADSDAAPVTAPVAEVRDSLGPVWAPGAATLRAVTLGPESTLRITLVDKDLAGEDVVGVVVLTSAQLRKAEATDGALAVPVAEATGGQVLSVSVLVVATPK